MNYADVLEDKVKILKDSFVAYLMPLSTATDFLAKFNNKLKRT
jgi:hypothetical protein